MAEQKAETLSDGFVDLHYDKKALDRLAKDASGKDGEEINRKIGEFQELWGIWAKGGVDHIKGVGFVAEAGRLTKVAMILDPEYGYGDRLEVATEIFERAFGLKHYEKQGGEGMDFGTVDGEDLIITAKSSAEEVEKAMSQVRVDGVGLQYYVDYFLDSKEPKPLGTRDVDLRTDESRGTSLEMENFLDFWNSGKVEQVEVDSRDGALYTLRLIGEDGQNCEVPVPLFWNALKNVDLENLETPRNMDLTTVDGKTARINQSIGDKRLTDIFRSIAIDGIKLDENITARINERTTY